MSRIGRAQQRAFSTISLARWIVTANQLIHRANVRWEAICKDKGWGYEPLTTRTDFHRGVALRLPPKLRAEKPSPISPERDVALAFEQEPALVRLVAGQYLFERYECLAAIRQGGRI